MTGKAWVSLIQDAGLDRIADREEELQQRLLEIAEGQALHDHTPDDIGLEKQAINNELVRLGKRRDYIQRCQEASK